MHPLQRVHADHLLRNALRAARAGVALTLLVGAACADGTPAPAPAASHNPIGAYEALGECPEQPSPPALDPVPGVYLPGETAIFTVSRLGPLTQVDGFVGLTPIEVREHYERRSDIDLLQIEDEGFETEALLSDGEHRMYVKARVLCRTGSNITATVGSEADAGALPTPSASPSPPPTP